jgi:hypothetical protein
MRHVKNEVALEPAIPAAPSSRPANLKRRGFLLTLGVGGAGAAVVAARSLSSGAVITDVAATPSDDGGYSATKHVQTYYKTAKV